MLCGGLDKSMSARLPCLSSEDKKSWSRFVQGSPLNSFFTSYFICMTSLPACVYMPMCVPGALRDQMRALNALELQL